MRTYRYDPVVYLDKLDVQVGVGFDLEVSRDTGGLSLVAEPAWVEENGERVADGYTDSVAYIRRTWPQWKPADWAEDAYAEVA